MKQLFRFRKETLLLIGVLALLCVAQGTLDRYLTTYDSISDLLTNNDPRGRFKKVRVLGYYSVGDGGGGEFYVNDTSSGTNNTTRIYAGLSGKSYERNFTGPLTAAMAGARGNGTSDDQLPLQELVNLGSSLSVPVELNRGKTYKVSGTLWFTNNNVTLDGRGATIYGSSDVRLLCVSNANNGRLSNLILQGLTNGTTQAGLRYDHATNWVDDNVVAQFMGLNGFEITHSERIRSHGRRALDPKTFGMFFYMSQDCDDWAYVIERPGSFGREYKDSKRSYGHSGKIKKPLAEMAVYFWTGFGTGPEIPGDMLTEDCGEYDLYVEGGPNTKQLVYINAARRCFVRGAYLVPDVDSSWGVIDVNGGFFYNEGLTMTGDVTTGSTNILNVSNASQLKAGDRIHIANSLTNHTVYSVSGTTVALYTTNDITATGAILGFFVKPDFADLQDITIMGQGENATQHNNSIQIGGTLADPLEGISLKNVKSEASGNIGLYVQHAAMRVEGGLFRNSAGLEEWHLDAGAVVKASKVLFQSSTNIGSYGVYLQNGAKLSATDCEWKHFGISGISPHADGDEVHLVGGLIEDVLEQPLGLFSNSSAIGTEFKGNLWDLGSFSAEIRVYGTNNTTMGLTMNPNGSTWISEHIKEEPGATRNFYGASNYRGGVANNVVKASGSTSRMLDANGIDAPITGFLDLPDRTTVTIASGAITLTRSVHVVETEGGASSDDLVTINGTNSTRVAFLSVANASHEVTLKHNAGNIWCDGEEDIVLNGGLNELVMLIYNDAQGVWRASLVVSQKGIVGVRVKEQDGAPSVKATEIRVPNGSLTDIGGGAVSLDFSTGGAGEANTASNKGNGANVFIQKTGVDFEFRSITNASTKASVTQTSTNIAIDVVEGNLTLSNLGGSVTDGQIPAAIARDSEVAAGYQPLDSDLSSVANDAPGNSKYFGTDSGGAKGFYDLPVTTHSAYVNGTNINDINFTDGPSVLLIPNSSTNVAVQLEGDSETPGASTYYGTDESGVKGFFPLLDSNWVPDGLTDSVLLGKATVVDLEASGNIVAGSTNVISALAGKSPLFSTSTALRNLISDPEGTGPLLFKTSPTVTTPTAEGYLDIASRADDPSLQNGRIWNKNGDVFVRSGGATVNLGSIPSVAGSDAQVQYNNGGVFAGAAGLTIGDGTNVFMGKATITNDLTVLNEAAIGTGNGSLDIGATGVNLSSDGDGAITFTGLGDGFDENFTINLDDTSNTAVVSSSTGLNIFNFSGIKLQKDGTDYALTLSPTIVTPLIDDYAEFNEESAPSTPGTAKVRLYAKSDGLLYSKDDAGTETLVSGGTGGGGGGTAGTMINSGTPVAGFVPAYGDTTGTNMVPSTGLSVGGTNTFSKGTHKANDLVTTNGVANVGSGAGVVYVKDSGGSHSFSFTPNSSISTDANIVGPTAPFAGFPIFDSVASATNMPMRAAVEGSDYRGLKVASADVVITSAGFVDITNLTFSVSSGSTYEFEAFVRFTTSATAMGVLFGVNGPSSPTTLFVRSEKQITAGGTASADMFSEAILTAYDTPLPNSTSEAETNPQLWKVSGIIKPSAGGTFALRMSKENVAGTATVLTGSFMRWQKIL